MIYYKNTEAPAISYNGKLTVNGKELEYKEEKGIVEAPDALLHSLNAISGLIYLGKDKSNLKKVTNEKANSAGVEKYEKKIAELEKQIEEGSEEDPRALKKIEKLNKINDNQTDQIKNLSIQNSDLKGKIKDLSKNADKALLKQATDLQEENIKLKKELELKEDSPDNDTEENP